MFEDWYKKILVSHFIKICSPLSLIVAAAFTPNMGITTAIASIITNNVQLTSQYYLLEVLSVIVNARMALYQTVFNGLITSDVDAVLKFILHVKYERTPELCQELFLILGKYAGVSDITVVQ
jgi:HD superfamily phosphohydrolase